MVIHGFQKMTLLDFPGKVAATVFTAGCNLACPFCHNALLVTDIRGGDRIDEDEVLSFLSRRKGLLDGVAITGGEPLLQPDIVSFIQKVRALGFPVKLDTNGTFPDRLKEIVGAGLVDYVAMDVKNRREKYAETTGCEHVDTDAVDESIRFLNASGIPHEFRTTVVDEFHTVDDIAAIAEWIQGTPAYFLQQFVDSGALIEDGLHAASKEKMAEMLTAAAVFVPSAAIRGQ